MGGRCAAIQRPVAVGNADGTSEYRAITAAVPKSVLGGVLGRRHENDFGP